MLTYEEYLSLCEDLQTQVLSFDGVYLELMRSCCHLNVELYSLYNFYVEIVFDKETEEPLYLRPFEKTKFLEPYLEKIDITAWLKIPEKDF